MKVTILGSGTSSGVPVIACECDVCSSKDPKNKRLRSSIFIEVAQAGKKSLNLVIDTGPDFRMQMLRADIKHIDAVLFTHGHADHIFGLDDIRIFNFRSKSDIPVYGEKKLLQQLKTCFPYSFDKDPLYEGGGIPSLIPREIDSGVSFTVSGIEILPLRVMHGRQAILGYRIGDLGYCTDCSELPRETIDALSGVNTLILSGLRYRPHKTHCTIPEAIEISKEIGAKRTLLTHIAHEVEHHATNAELQAVYGESVSLAYDGLELSV